MTRIISGSAGGRRIVTPPGQSTRPTSDRAREALFSALESLLGGWEGIAVLDVFAGSGAIGIEALSRGARSADFVESGAKAAGVIRRNLRDLDLLGTVHQKPAESGAAHGSGPFDLVFLDPPYELPTQRLKALLTALAASGALAPGAVIVVERSSRSEFTWPDAFTAYRDRRYGETVLWYGQFHG